MKYFQKNKWEKWIKYYYSFTRKCIKENLIPEKPIFLLSNISLIKMELKNVENNINISYLNDLEYKLIQDFKQFDINILDCDTFNRKMLIEDIVDDNESE